MADSSRAQQDQVSDDLVLLHEIYPGLSRDQLLEAKENLDRYFDLAVRIFLRLENEREAKTLTAEALDPKVISKVEIPLTIIN